MDIRTFRIGDISEMRVLWNEVVLAGNAFPQTDPLRDDAEALSFFRRQTRTAVAVVPSEAGDQDRVVGLYILHPNNVGRWGERWDPGRAGGRGGDKWPPRAGVWGWRG